LPVLCSVVCNDFTFSSCLCLQYSLVTLPECRNQRSCLVRNVDQVGSRCQVVPASLYSNPSQQPVTVSDACGSAKAHKYRNCSTFAYKVRAFVHTAACCYGIKRLATAKAWCIIKDIDRRIHTSLASTVRQKLSHHANTHCSQGPAHALNRSNDRQNNRKQSTINLLNTYIST